MNAHQARFRLAQLIGTRLPPVIAHLPALAIYPWRTARQDKRTVDARSVTGSSLRVTTANEYGHLFALLGFYEWKVLAVATAVCREGDTVIEIGANIGTETVGFADIVGRFGRVICFEPAPVNLTSLQKAFAVNGLDNVCIVPMAVAAASGTRRFVLVDSDDGNTGLGHLDYGDGFRPGTVADVSAVALDAFLGDRDARLLMMDVEGGEPEVLSGGERWISRNRPVIILEAHHHRSALHRWLTAHGYEVHSIERLGLKPPRTEDDVAQYNWLAIHRAECSLAAAVDRQIRRCGLCPRILVRHPLAVGTERR